MVRPARSKADPGAAAAAMTEADAEADADLATNLDGTAVPGAPATTRRALWGAVDQGLYGITNFALSIMVAASVTAVEFGAFSVVLIAYTLTIGAMEGLTSEAYTVAYGDAEPEVARRALVSAGGFALAAGVLVAIVAVVARVAYPDTATEALPAFALVVPALYLQDLWRFAFFAMHRPQAAVVNDAVWAAVQVAGIVIIVVTGHATVPYFVLVWGAGALAGAVLGAFQASVVPNPTRAFAWLRDHGAYGWRFAGEFITLFGASQVVLGVLWATAGLAALGGIRAAQVLFSPLQGLLNAVRLSVTSLAVQVRTTRPKELRGFTIRLAAILGGLAVVAGAIALLLPDSVGEAVLGDSWDGAKAVLLPISVLNVVMSVSLAALTALRAAKAAQISFRVRALTSVLVVILGSAGALASGANAAAWGIALGSAIGLVVIVRQAWAITANP